MACMGGWVYFALDHWFKGALFASGAPVDFQCRQAAELLRLKLYTGVCFCGVRGDSGVATADSLLAYRYDVLTTRTRVVTHIPMCWCTCVLWCLCINMYQALHDR